MAHNSSPFIIGLIATLSLPLTSMATESPVDLQLSTYVEELHKKKAPEPDPEDDVSIIMEKTAKTRGIFSDRRRFYDKLKSDRLETVQAMVDAYGIEDWQLIDIIANASIRLIEKHYEGIGSVLAGLELLKSLTATLKLTNDIERAGRLKSLALSAFHTQNKFKGKKRVKILSNFGAAKEILDRDFKNYPEFISLIAKTENMSRLRCYFSGGLEAAGGWVFAGAGGFKLLVCHTPMGQRMKVRKGFGAAGGGFMGSIAIPIPDEETSKDPKKWEPDVYYEDYSNNSAKWEPVIHLAVAYLGGWHVTLRPKRMGSPRHAGGIGVAAIATAGAQRTKRFNLEPNYKPLFTSLKFIAQ